MIPALVWWAFLATGAAVAAIGYALLTQVDRKRLRGEVRALAAECKALHRDERYWRCLALNIDPRQLPCLDDVLPRRWS